MSYSKKRLDKVLITVALIIYYLMTPIIFYLADLMRGHSGTGGEIIYPLLPILCVVFSNLVKVEEEDEDD